MKIKLLALGFSLIFLAGNAARGASGEGPKRPIHTLQTFVVLPYKVKLLNDQKLTPIDYQEIIRNDVEEISRKNRQGQISTMIAFDLKTIFDVTEVASANILNP